MIVMFFFLSGPFLKSKLFALFNEFGPVHTGLSVDFVFFGIGFPVGIFKNRFEIVVYLLFFSSESIS